MAQSYLPPQLQRSRWRPTLAERRMLRRQRAHFERVRRAELGYAQRLRNISRTVSRLIDAFTIGDQAQLPDMIDILNRYSYIIRPWAETVGAKMIAEVSRRDANAWFKTSRDIGVYLRDMIENAPIGHVIRGLLDDQVELITSIPIEAGRRVQEHTMDFVAGGKRYDELVELIHDTNDVTVNRATLIARTETAKAQSAIVEARARHIGSDQYIWRTMMDSAVRPMHRGLEGTVQSWDDPPEAEANGEHHHPGNFPNCRCYAEPLLSAIIT
jgi:SPP1 gp7 family putative phage head morphogenesis protein